MPLSIACKAPEKAIKRIEAILKAYQKRTDDKLVKCFERTLVSHNTCMLYFVLVFRMEVTVTEIYHQIVLIFKKKMCSSVDAGQASMQ